MFQYAIAQSIMTRVDENGYGKWNDLSKHIYNAGSHDSNLRDDLTIIYLSHTETDYDDMGNKFTKIKTAGKLIDKQVTFDGLFTTVLYSEVIKGENGLRYVFRTRTNGQDTCKSPMGMFEDTYIDNDLQFVLNRMDEYYRDEAEIVKPKKTQSIDVTPAKPTTTQTTNN